MSTYWLLVFVWFSPADGQIYYNEFTNNADGNMYSSYGECIKDGAAYANEVLVIDPSAGDFLTGECYLVVDENAE